MDKPVRNPDSAEASDAKDDNKDWDPECKVHVLIRPPPSCTANILPAENPLLVNCNTPTEEEVRRAILTLHNGKAAGPADGIPAEALKTAPYTSVAMLGNIIERVWEEEVVPDDWKEGFLVKLPKKAIRVNVTAIEELCFFQCQEKHLTE